MDELNNMHNKLKKSDAAGRELAQQVEALELAR